MSLYPALAQLPKKPHHCLQGIIHWPFGEWRWALLLWVWPGIYLSAQPYDKVQALAQQAQASTLQYEWVRDTLLEVAVDYPVVTDIYYLADSMDRYVIRRYTYLPREMKQLRKALQWLDDPNKAEKAVPLLRQLLKRQPRNTEIMYYMAQWYWQQGDYATAATWARKATRINPIHPKAYVLLARCELQASDYAAALRSISFARLYNRNDPQITPLLTAIYARNRLVYDDRWGMYGHYTIIPSAQKVQITYRDEPWRALALCEALWAYEPHYEALHTQQYLQPPSEVRQQACLYAWYEAYLDWTAAPERKRQFYAAQAYETAHKADLLSTFVLYEWTLVQRPTAAYLLSVQEREKVLRYLTTVRSQREQIATDFLSSPGQ